MDIFKNLQAEMALEEIKQNTAISIEIGKVLSKRLKGYYDVLIKEGFTEEQALRIVINHGPTYGIRSNGQE